MNIGVMRDIELERHHQVELGYDAAHDDQHTAGEFVGFIDEQIASAALEGYPRERFKKIAALAIAAMESMTRKAEAEAGAP